jgi:predicted transcriptional regulator of viral defense system
MRTETFNDYLRSHKISVLSVYDAAKITSMPSAYASKFLAGDRYLKRAERGVYYTKDASEYEAASRMLFPSYVSMVSALRFHNLTEQIPRRIYVIGLRQHKAVEDLNGYVVEFSKIKKELMYGYRKIDGAFVADPEKAVIDMLYLNRFVEYAEEAVESGNLDRERLERYAAQSGVKEIAKKIGAMLDVDKR